MPSYKAEAYARILNEAKDAKPIDGKENVYTPEEYNKVIKAERLMADLDQGGEWVTAQVSTGDVEFDQYGHLKKIGRAKPAMLPVEIYTANKYMLDVHTEEQEYIKKDAEGKEVKATRTIKIKDILVVMGHPFVQAIESSSELPPTVKVHRFRKTTQGNWKYVGPEFIKAEDCRKMTNNLTAKAMFSLMKQMEASKISTNETGDNLEDIA